MNLQIYQKSLKQKGNIAYEYHPFHNYQTSVDIYKVEKDGIEYCIPYKQAINLDNGELLNKIENGSYWVDKRSRIIENYITWDGHYINGGKFESVPSEILYPAGSLIDLDTDKLNFDLNHPVDITIQPSYDGSVNLILNDDKNIPRLINSRFSVREKNTYEIVDRIGENDTNIYNSDTFDKDTSLYFQCETNPVIKYLGFINGILPVGQYCFYFTYCDADDNESDYIAESGLIPVFIGSDSDPNSIDGGIKNQNSNKGIRLRLNNIDKSYNYLKVYYVRYFADYEQNRVYECKKIYQKYPINSNLLYLQITGNEEAEDIDPNILNIQRFNPKSILTQAQCKNMLFFGNIVKNTDNYTELQDCALRIIPKVYEKDFEKLNNDYESNQTYCYYNSINIYNQVGYFDQEFYRFGIVFIYKNGTLSNVYNTLGCTLSPEDKENKENNCKIKTQLFVNNNEGLRIRQYIKIDDFGWIKNEIGQNLNARGVCQFKYNKEYNDSKIFGIKFEIPIEVIDYLKKDLGVRGLFFVRQKRIPNVLAQCYLMPLDKILEAPVIKIGNEYQTECFVTQNDRLIRHDYKSRLYKYQNKTDNISKNAYAAICPDFLLNQPYYNQIFNGGKFRIQQISKSNSELVSNSRYYKEKEDTKYEVNKNLNLVKICSVTENVSQVAINDQIFSLNKGYAEEVFRFKYAEQDNSSYTLGEGSSEDVTKATNIVRGIYSPFLAIYSSQPLNVNALYNIYRENVINIIQEFQNRMDSSEPFYAISDRYNFEDLDTISNTKIVTCWRGDCYLNTFTYRLNRNFNDPTLPNNDTIIDEKTWLNNYDAEDQTKWEKISRSDLNAIQMGSWITFKVRSYMNYALRSEDHSYVSEEALMGSPRSFYPRQKVMWKGNNKQPDSYLYNDAYRASLGFKCYFTLQDINYLKNSFSNRIQYSAISIQDSFKNNYRESLSTYFRDYSQEYGGITKLVGFEGYLLVIFEHAIAVAVVNERVLAGNGDGEPVFINTQNVLPEELTIISDTYGTQWGDSVIKSEVGYVYGVDTIAKKIWKVKGQQIEILSDLKVNKFLIDNISLGEREVYPIIGLKNVKTHYNNNKKDIIFTFYDDIYKDEEKVWSLCYNELLNQFITFYSWIPSFSENIDTQFFTFNRNTAKKLSLLSKCNYAIPENTGVLVDTPILKESDNYYQTQLYYCTINKEIYGVGDNLITKEINRYLQKDVKFHLEKDHWKYYEQVNINENTGEVKVAKGLFNNNDIIIIYITPYIENNNGKIILQTESIALTIPDKLNEYTTHFYIHGQSGIITDKDPIYPTHWYDEYHPFEFEFVVNDKIAQQKIFQNLIIISNKAEPESFHFEIEGDNYEFSSDKRTMYFRQESTKNLFQNLGSDILYDRDFENVKSNGYTYEQYYRGNGINPDNGTKNNYESYKNSYPVQNKGLVRQVKSTIFPLYYERIDTYNDIYHHYSEMKGNNYDFKNLSGSEIKWIKDSNQFDIVTHIKNSPIDLVGRMRGNSMYKEGKWNIQIPSIIFSQKNENWTDLPPIIVNSQNIPNDLRTEKVSKDKLPNIYINPEQEDLDLRNYLEVGEWTNRKETKIRDKWIKIRIRYSGKNLAVIHSLITLYNISYS